MRDRIINGFLIVLILGVIFLLAMVINSETKSFDSSLLESERDFKLSAMKYDSVLDIFKVYDYEGMTAFLNANRNKLSKTLYASLDSVSASEIRYSPLADHEIVATYVGDNIIIYDLIVMKDYNWTVMLKLDDGGFVSDIESIGRREDIR